MGFFYKLFNGEICPIENLVRQTPEYTKALQIAGINIGIAFACTNNCRIDLASKKSGKGACCSVIRNMI